MNTTLARALLEALPHEAVLLDDGGRVVVANRAAARRALREPRALEGQDYFDAFGPLGAYEQARAAFHAGPPGPALASEFQTGGALVRLRGLESEGQLFVLVTYEPATGEERLRRVAEAWDAALTLVREVRHEINNPLMGIMGNLELLQGRRDLPEAVSKKVDQMAHEADRIRGMTAKLSAIRPI